MSVSVDHGFDMIEAVDGVGETGGAEILQNLQRLTRERVYDRGIMEPRNAALRAERSQPVLELARLVQCLVDKRLDDRLAERRQLAASEPAEEALDPGKAHSLDFGRLLIENGHSGLMEDRADFFRLTAFVVMIAEHPEHRDGARTDVVGENLGFSSLAEVGEVAAQYENVGRGR